jgi:ADP-ribose pyrophosphatase YjhB (NUDIX family)
MPTLGVNVAILDDRNRLLLTRREDFDTWCLPGGGVEVGETLAQAARREAQEETGLQVALTRLVGVYSRPGASRFSGHIFVFAARPIGGAPAAQPGETTEVRFFNPDELPADLVQLAPLRIRHILQGLGGSAVWAIHQDWRFPPGFERLEIYRLRDDSGLSRQEFYQRHMGNTLPPGIVRELPGDGLVSLLRQSDTGLAELDSYSPAVAAIVAIMRGGKLILTRREDFEVWCLPGGSVDESESLADTARREAEEETGLKVRLTHLVGVYSRLNWYGRGIHLVVFGACPVGGSLQPQPDEVLNIDEFGVHDLPADMLLGHREMALDALTGAGGSCAWTQRVPWPFPPAMTRSEIYALRDASGLSRTAFYRAYFRQVQPGDETDELEE